MDSKYNAGEAIKDFIQFRAYVDSGVEKPKITITPYADIYATVSYANGRVVAKRARRNEQIIIENPFSTAETENDQETYIYSASQLKSIGDISCFCSCSSVVDGSGVVASSSIGFLLGLLVNVAVVMLEF